MQFSGRLQKLFDDTNPGGDALSDLAINYLGIVRGAGQSDASFEDSIVNRIRTEYRGDHILAVAAASGKDRHAFGRDETLAELTLCQMMVRAKKADAALRGDSSMTMSPMYFADILAGQGFERVLDYPFDFHQDTYHFALWCRRDDAMLVQTEGNATRVSGSKLLYEIALPAPTFDATPQDFLRTVFNLRHGCSQNPFEVEGAAGYAIDFDCREGIIAHLDALKASGIKTHKPWRHMYFRPAFLWDMQEGPVALDGPRALSRYIRNRKLDQLPKDVQEMLGYVQGNDPQMLLELNRPNDDYLTSGFS